MQQTYFRAERSGCPDDWRTYERGAYSEDARRPEWCLSGEARWYLTVAGLTLLLTAIPTLLAYTQRHDGLGFVGMLWTPRMPPSTSRRCGRERRAARG